VPEGKELTVTVRGVAFTWPVPESEIVAGELVALLTTDTLPATLPATVGASPIFSETLCPAARLSGSEKPLKVKPAPV